MTLEGAIKHCKEVADHCRWKGITVQERERSEKCADEHQQLAEWLTELKEYREKDSSDNTPLTWYELTHMEGEPVWIEYRHENFSAWYCWCIIYVCNMEYDKLVVFDEEGDKERLEKNEMGKIWKAYRKKNIHHP